MKAYYNEHDPYAAQWLRNLIAEGLIPAGEVDERSIADVAPGDLRRFGQCHFFAGIGGWALAARLAGWPDSRELWTGSAPCQPFSVAGQGKAQADDRHLWPHLFRLVRTQRPTVLMGEQVAAAVGKDWLDGICDDLEGIGYACGAIVVPACAVDAPHRRDRLWFVADTREQGLAQRVGVVGVSGELGGEHERQDAADDAATGAVADAMRDGVRNESGGGSWQDRSGSRLDIDYRSELLADTDRSGSQARPHDPTAGHGDTPAASLCASPWRAAGWILGHDGKVRRVEPSIRLLAHGVPARVGRLRAYGNAIVPQVAAEVIGAYLDCRP